MARSSSKTTKTGKTGKTGRAAKPAGPAKQGAARRTRRSAAAPAEYVWPPDREFAPKRRAKRPAVENDELARLIRAADDEAARDHTPVAGYDPLRDPKYLRQEASRLLAEAAAAENDEEQGAAHAQRLARSMRRAADVIAPTEPDEDEDEDDEDDEPEPDVMDDAYEGPEDPDDDPDEYRDPDEDDEGEDGGDWEDEEEEDEAPPPPARRALATGRRGSFDDDAPPPPTIPPRAERLSGWLDVGDARDTAGRKRFTAYHGWYIKVRLDQSLGFFKAAEKMARVSQELARARATGTRPRSAVDLGGLDGMLRDGVAAWNYVDQLTGEPLPQPPEGLDALRGDLLLATFLRMSEALIPAKKPSPGSRRR